MKEIRSARQSLVLVVLVAVLVGCTTAANTPADPTITVSNGKCAYTGPSPIPSKFNLVMDIRDTAPPASYIFGFAILEDGATVDDLKTITADDVTQLNGLSLNTQVHPGIHWLRSATPLKSGVSHQNDIDLASNARFHGQPIYITCAGSTGVFEVIGPLTVAS